MNVGDVVETIDARLRASGSAERAVKEKAYLKSALEHYGVAVPVVRRVAKEIVKRSAASTRDDLWTLVEELWSAAVHERRLCAIVLLGQRSRLLEVDDMDRMEQLLRESGTWALVDTLAASAVSDLVEREPRAAEWLDRWATDDDFWIRRSALLALVPGLQRGEGDWPRFARYADRMLDEREFFIRKAIGWGLRETGRKRPELVVEWLVPRAARLSTVTLREAVKPLNDEQRQAVGDAPV